MKEKKQDSRETYDFEKNIKFKNKQYAKDDLIDRPVNQAKRYEIGGEGIPARGSAADEQEFQDTADITKKEEMLREDTEREMGRRKDARNTYDFNEDVRYRREQYAGNDIIDRPVNQGVRSEIKGRIGTKAGNDPEKNGQ